MARLSKRERQEIVSAYLSGEDRNAIGRRYGVHPGYVSKLASRAGVAKRPAVGVAPRATRLKPKRPVKPGHSINPLHMGSGRRHVAPYTKLM